METTERGFARFRFIDRYNKHCSIQKSSLAFENAIWLGIDHPEIKIDVVGHGLVNFPLPVGAFMHLTQDMVRELLPMLQTFAETGELENANPVAPQQDEKKEGKEEEGAEGEEEGEEAAEDVKEAAEQGEEVEKGEEKEAEEKGFGEENDDGKEAPEEKKPDFAFVKARNGRNGALREEKKKKEQKQEKRFRRLAPPKDRERCLLPPPRRKRNFQQFMFDSVGATVAAPSPPLPPSTIAATYSERTPESYGKILRKRKVKWVQSHARATLKNKQVASM